MKPSQLHKFACLFSTKMCLIVFMLSSEPRYFHYLIHVSWWGTYSAGMSLFKELPITYFFG